MYHLNGAHSPYVMDENAQAVPSDSIGVDSQIRGIFKIIKEYMDELKAKGIYDSSTIIITIMEELTFILILQFLLRKEMLIMMRWL